MREVTICILLISLLSISSCSSISSSSAQSANQSVPIINTQSVVNTNISQSEKKLDSKDYPPVLQGWLNFADTEKNNQTTVSVSLSGGTINETINRGFAVSLPPIGTTVEMDIMNCFGYLGSARVTYQGLQDEAWTVELNNASKPSDLQQRMLRCVDDSKNAATKKFLTDPKYLSNFVFLIAPTNEKRKQIQITKKPDWDVVLQRIPYEWLKSANLPRRNPNAERLKICIGGWTDSDGDGTIDIITLCAVNEETRYEYYRTLQMVNNNWRQLWQTTDSRD